MVIASSVAIELVIVLCRICILGDSWIQTPTPIATFPLDNVFISERSGWHCYARYRVCSWEVCVQVPGSIEFADGWLPVFALRRPGEIVDGDLPPGSYAESVDVINTSSDSFATAKVHEIREVAFGSVLCWLSHVQTQSRSAFDSTAVSVDKFYSFRAYGFLVNVVIIGVVVGSISSVGLRLVVWSRLRRRLCIYCGYPSALGSVYCPECGDRA